MKDKLARLQPVDNQTVCKRPSFSLQKTAFWRAIHGLLQGDLPQIGFIRSLGVLAFVAIGPRRGPTMLNRMCGEAELAVGMQQ